MSVDTKRLTFLLGAVFVALLVPGVVVWIWSGNPSMLLGWLATEAVGAVVLAVAVGLVYLAFRLFPDKKG